MGTLGKLSVILVAWFALIVLTTFYCYFCEQRLFPKQRMLDWVESEGANDSRWTRRFKWRWRGKGLFGHRREEWDDGSYTSFLSAWY